MQPGIYFFLKLSKYLNVHNHICLFTGGKELFIIEQSNYRVILLYKKQDLNYWDLKWIHPIQVTCQTEQQLGHK